LKKCHALLKKSGYLVVSEAVYFLNERPQEVIEFWQSEYPAITSVEQNIKEIKAAGYTLISHFPLPDRHGSIIFTPHGNTDQSFKEQV